MTTERGHPKKAPNRKGQPRQASASLVAQLQRRITELETANCDLASMLASTAMACIVLDGQLRVRRVAPAPAPSR